MKTVKFLSTAIMFALTAFSLFAEKEDTKKLADGNNKFAIDLYSKLKDEVGNIFYSPYSITTALGMTYAGAKNNTEKEMAKVLHFTEGTKETCKSFGTMQKMLNGIQEKENIKLGIANAIWAQKDYKFLKTYFDLVQNDFGSKLKNVDFKNPETCEKARLDINGWVEGKTNDKIKDLIAKGILNGMTRMVLVNAIYFKGDWKTQFKEYATNKKGIFFTSPDKKVTVPMMSQSEKFHYAEDKSTQVLAMPYKGKETSMFVFLPKAKDGIAKLEKSLTLDYIKTLMDNMRREKVLLYFPKFKIETKYELNKILPAMGMKDAFGLKADFSGMTGDTDLYISNVIHKAFVEVDEKGTEAAAATAVIMMDKSAARPTKRTIFKADHPFIYMIVEHSTGNILFMGRMSNPEK